MKTILTFLTASLALLLASSCVMEEIFDPETDSGGQNSLTLCLTIPDNRVPTTRAMDDTQQQELKTVDLLVFDAGTSPETLLDHIGGLSATPVEENFTVTTNRLAGTENFRLVVVANAGEAVSTALGTLSDGGIGAEKQDVLDVLTVAQNGKWPSDGSQQDLYLPIPMYGESGVFQHIQSTVGAVTLTRMLARIDVEVLQSAQTSFTLQKVHLINYNQAGYIAPAWDSADGTLTASALQMPNMPDNTAKNTWTQDGDQISYTASVSGLSSDIFTFESTGAYDANEGQSTSNPEATCLILEGLYNGALSFYRVDFTYSTTDVDAGTTKGNYMPLLRNHKYKVTVEAARGKGYDTIGEAVEAFGIESNLKTRTLNYDLTEINQIVFNGQYMLGVGTTQYESETSSVLMVKREAGAYSLKVFTDNPGGWKATVGSDARSWLQISASPIASTSWNSTAQSTVSEAVSDLSVQIQNNAGSLRRGEIVLTAGRLSYTVAVQQSSDTGVEIRIIDASHQDITSLSFGNENLEAQRFYVLWSPSDVQVTVTSRVIGTRNSGFENDGNFAEASIPQSTVSGGGEMFNLLPPERNVIDEGGDYSTEYTFTVTSGGSTYSKSIRVSQFVSQRMPRANSYIVAPAWENGDAYSIMIPVSRANEFPGNQLNGNDYQILPADAYVAELIWTDIPGGVNPDKSTAIAEIVAHKAVSSPTIDDCFIKVTPGKREGNAVIAVRKNSGEPDILWSWHVWVTRYNPGAGISGSFEGGIRLDPTPIPGGAWANADEMYGRVYRYNTGAGNAYSNNIFMDRNLGAADVSISTTGGINHDTDAQKVATYGLLYQWGRKDPFPGSSSSASSTQKAIYGANGNVVSINKNGTQSTTGSTGGRTRNNLDNLSSETNRNNYSVVRKPTRIYYETRATSATFDWYTSVYNNTGNTSNYDLWGNGGDKTIYDPCPPGWRVPESGQARGNNLGNTTTLYNYDQAYSPWYGLSNMATSFSNGYFWEDAGWYPAAGYYGSGNGQLTQTGLQGLYWSAGAAGSSFPAENREGTATEANHQQFRSHLANMFNIANGQDINESNVNVFDLMEAGRVRALSVRCVVDM